MHRRPGESEHEPRLDYHDPTAGIGGAPPAASALTLRAWLAGLGLTACLVGIAVSAVVSGPVLLVVGLGIVAVTALLDLFVIGRRQRREHGG